MNLVALKEVSWMKNRDMNSHASLWLTSHERSLISGRYEHCQRLVCTEETEIHFLDSTWNPLNRELFFAGGRFGIKPHISCGSDYSDKTSRSPASTFRKKAAGRSPTFS